jgi:hypothetical protein
MQRQWPHRTREGQAPLILRAAATVMVTPTSPTRTATTAARPGRETRRGFHQYLRRLAPRRNPLSHRWASFVLIGPLGSAFRRPRALSGRPSPVCCRRRVVTRRCRRSAEPASRIRRCHIPPTSSRPRRPEPSRWPGGEQDRSCNGARSCPRGGRWTGHRGRAEHGRRRARSNPRHRTGRPPANVRPRARSIDRNGGIGGHVSSAEAPARSVASVEVFDQALWLTGAGCQLLS